MEKKPVSGAILFWCPFTVAFVIANWKFLYFLLRSDFDSEYILSITDNLYQNNIFLVLSTLVIPTAFALAHIYLLPHVYLAFSKRHLKSQADLEALATPSAMKITSLGDDISADK